MIGFVLPGPAAPEACAQLRRLGVRSGDAGLPQEAGTPGQVLRDLAAALAEISESVVVSSGHFLLHDEAVAELVLDPRDRTGAAVSGASGALDVRRRGGQVISAGSGYHAVTDPDSTFVGVLAIGRADVARAARALLDMASAVDAESPGDLTSYALVALVRSGIAVAAVDIDPWPWSRVGNADDVVAFVDAAALIDAPRTKLARALRPDDGFYSTFVVRRLSSRLTPAALRAGLRPNQITVASLLIGLLAAVCFAFGARSASVLGALLLQLSLVVDCIDGEVARYTRAFSSLGAWFDASTDRIKEYACYAGLAFGAERIGDSVDPWLLAGAMLSLQTTRHTSDYTFKLVQGVREQAAITVPLGQREDALAEPALRPGAGPPFARRRGRHDHPILRWGKKAIYLPIGERWLAISVTAALGSAYLVFQTLLVLAVLALVYTTTARLWASRTWTAESATEAERHVVRVQLDRGPLACALARLSPWPLPMGSVSWTMPPMLRAIEFGCVLLVVHRVSPDAMPATFALLFVVAYHHYDSLYRALTGLPPAGAVRAAGLGVEGRLLVIGAVAVLAPGAMAAALVILAIVLGVLFLGVGTAGGLRALRSARPALQGAAISV